MPYIIGPNGERLFQTQPPELRPQETEENILWFEEAYPKQKEEEMDKENQQETKENKIKTIKRKCEICGKTTKKVVTKDEDYAARNFKMIEYYRNGKSHYICKNCEDRYHITSDYFARGYGYAGSTFPNRTSADKTSTPTYGVEIEVAGNIKNINKIGNLIYQNYECTIGYDTSVDGAQFEFSYAPGTYYWYLYESKLKAVCQLLQKDEWVNRTSTTAGMHIHVQTPNKPQFVKALIQESLYDMLGFWSLIRIFGERELNQYCREQISTNHHSAISLSQKWHTVEFRIFRTTFDFETIMNRIKFIRQIIDNSDEYGVNWANIRQDSKDWFMKLINKSRIHKELKARVLDLFNTTLEERLSQIEETEKEEVHRRAEEYVQTHVLGYEEDEEENEEEW